MYPTLNCSAIIPLHNETNLTSQSQRRASWLTEMSETCLLFISVEPLLIRNIYSPMELGNISMLPSLVPDGFSYTYNYSSGLFVAASGNGPVS